MDPSTQALASTEIGDGGDLYRLIAELDARFRALDIRLPDMAVPVDAWAGVLFRIRERAFLAPLAQIAEVLEPPMEITAIPGTQPWVVGVANNRGTLLPILDLSALAHGGVPAPRDTDRVLVVRQGALPCGLVVSEAIGIRHFATALRIPEPPSGLGVLTPFADAAFPLDGEPVAVLALDRLLADPMLHAGAM